MKLGSINGDVFHEICKALLNTTCSDGQGKSITGHQSIKKLSPTSRDMRKRLEPIVFRSIDLDMNYWVRKLEHLEHIERCHAVQHYVRRFHLKIYLPHDEDIKRMPNLPDRFAGVFRRAPKLESLSISVPEKEVRLYRAAVQKPDTDLSSVKTLTVGPRFEWLVDLCPDVTKISMYDNCPHAGLRPSPPTYALVRAASHATKLRTLDIEEYWNAELIEHIYELTPQLQGLGLLGTHQYFMLRDLLPPLSKFRELKALSMPMTSELGIGFHPPECGNAYMGPGGDEFARQIEEEERQAEDSASRMMFSVCPKLEVLWIGRSTKKTRPKEDDGPSRGQILILNEVNPLFT